MYDTAFPEEKIKLSKKQIESPYITTGLRRSSKRKQKLYEKWLRNKTKEINDKYKPYKHLFE